MNRITLKPVPEVNKDTILPPARIIFYPSAAEPDAVSVMLLNDETQVIEGGLRLTPEQVESLFYALGEHVGDEMFDLGFKAGVASISEGVA